MNFFIPFIKSGKKQTGNFPSLPTPEDTSINTASDGHSQDGDIVEFQKEIKKLKIKIRPNLSRKEDIQ
jgi:hypothetical protein